jgi:hypothetical protein
MSVYTLSTDKFNFKEIELMQKVGLNLEDTLYATRTTNLYRKAAAEVCRDELIKMGADPTKIRVEYFNGEY